MLWPTVDEEGIKGCQDMRIGCNLKYVSYPLGRSKGGEGVRPAMKSFVGRAF